MGLCRGISGSVTRRPSAHGGRPQDAGGSVGCLGLEGLHGELDELGTVPPEFRLGLRFDGSLDKENPVIFLQISHRFYPYGIWSLVYISFVLELWVYKASRLTVNAFEQRTGNRGD